MIDVKIVCVGWFAAIIDDTIFANPFAHQRRFNYFEPSDNEDDVDNVVVVDDTNVDIGIIPLVLEFIDAFVSRFVVSHDWVLSHRRMLGKSNLDVS